MVQPFSSLRITIPETPETEPSRQPTSTLTQLQQAISALAGKTTRQILSRDELKLVLRWLPALSSSEKKHCPPNADLDSIDWYEYTTSGGCNKTHCDVHAVQYNISDPSTPSIDEAYKAWALDIAEGEPHGQLSLSYFDRPGGAFAVGTHEMLNFASKRYKACHQAFRTLVTIQKQYDVPLAFDLEDPCSAASSASGMAQTPFSG